MTVLRIWIHGRKEKKKEGGGREGGGRKEGKEEGRIY